MTEADRPCSSKSLGQGIRQGIVSESARIWLFWKQLTQSFQWLAVKSNDATGPSQPLLKFTAQDNLYPARPVSLVLVVGPQTAHVDLTDRDKAKGLACT